MAKLIRNLFISLLLVAMLFLSLSALVWNGYLLQVPSLEKIASFKLPEASEIYSSDSVLLGKMYYENRKSISINELPNKLTDCLIATEDSRFFEHNGVDFIGLLRVSVKTLLLSENSGGGSTITQQLVKNQYPRNKFKNSNLLLHKIREWFTAMKMEGLYSKNEILEKYLNTVPFGHNCFGIHTASNYYFNKKPADLLIQEMATLIGLLKGTSQYDPQRNPNRSILRRNLVLNNMHKSGFLTKDKLKKALKSELLLAKAEEQEPYIAPFFMQHLKSKVKELVHSINESGKSHLNPYTDGLKLYTTINSRVQKHADSALKTHLNTLQTQFDAEWNERRWDKNKKTLLQLLRLKRFKGYKKVISFLENKSAFSPEIDALLKVMKTDLTRLHAGFTCIKNTGEVLAWVGGRDFPYSQYDHVKSRRQVGSVFKPIVYVTAIDQGVNICNYFKNGKKSYSKFDDWEPRNASNNYLGEYTIKGALTYSLNVISVQVLFRAGLLDVLNVAGQMGITTDIPNVPSISLGTPDISLYEMVNAYTCFANSGDRVDTKYLKSMYSASGELIYADEPEKAKNLFTANVAAIMTNMMESVVNLGTARSLRTKYHLKGAIAGKTGTTQNQSDGWFIGYTPQFAAGAWVGADNPDIHFKSIRQGAGAKTALPIWANFALNLQNDPKCAYLLEGKFIPPSKKSLLCLNQALYREKEL
jgi:penicillin-binding protein 1A